MTEHAQNANVQIEGVALLEVLLSGRHQNHPEGGVMNNEAMLQRARNCLRAGVAGRVVAVMQYFVHLTGNDLQSAGMSWNAAAMQREFLCSIAMC